VKALLSLILIVLAVVIVKGGIGRSQFFASDYLILDHVAAKSLPATLAAPDPIGDFYRPLSRQTWFWTLSRIGGGNPAVFHAANLALLVILLALLAWIAWTMAGPAAAAVAVTLIGFHEATDVVNHWAGASQDLLAVTLSLATILLYRAGAGVIAGITLFLALLSKETAIVTPILAVMVDRKSGEDVIQAIRRSAPLVVAVVVAGALWVLAVTRGPGIPGVNPPVNLGAVIPVLFHLGHVALGLEWGANGSRIMRPSISLMIALPILLALVAWLRPSRRERRVTARYKHAPAPGRALLVGLLWAGFAALPVVVSAATWSSYQYLLALCGSALAIGALLSMAPRSAALIAVAALLFTTDQVRRSEEFSTWRDPWKKRSHLNRAFIAHASDAQETMIANLKRARPDLPRNSTLYFMGPESAGLPTGDGPVLRWAYRDPTVRAYRATEFTEERARRGPNFFFAADGSGLRELQRPEEVRELAVDIVFAERLDPARDALSHLLRANADDHASRYWLAWVEMARGQHASAEQHMTNLGLRMMATDSVFLKEAPPFDDTYSNWREWLAWKRSPYKVLQDADKLVADGRAADAQKVLEGAVREHPFLPEMHGRLADVALGNGDPSTAAVEAFAARALAPEDPATWRRWGTILIAVHRPENALPAFEHYLELAGTAGASDREAQRIVEGLRNSLASAPPPAAPTPSSDRSSL
jgi:Tetratricopeptide repeat